jgi:hypothetical protein
MSKLKSSMIRKMQSLYINCAFVVLVVLIMIDIGSNGIVYVFIMQIDYSLYMFVRLSLILLLKKICVASINIVFLYKETIKRLCYSEVELSNHVRIFRHLGVT